MSAEGLQSQGGLAKGLAKPTTSSRPLGSARTRGSAGRFDVAAFNAKRPYTSSAGNDDHRSSVAADFQRWDR
jgi:hypothetical protein